MNIGSIFGLPASAELKKLELEIETLMHDAKVALPKVIVFVEAAGPVFQAIARVIPQLQPTAALLVQLLPELDKFLHEFAGKQGIVLEPHDPGPPAPAVLQRDGAI